MVFTSGASLAAFGEMRKAEQFIPELTWRSGVLVWLIAEFGGAIRLREKRMALELFRSDDCSHQLLAVPLLEAVVPVGEVAVAGLLGS
jgi:hypothetical protein